MDSSGEGDCWQGIYIAGLDKVGIGRAGQDGLGWDKAGRCIAMTTQITRDKNGTHEGKRLTKRLSRY